MVTITQRSFVRRLSRKPASAEGRIASATVTVGLLTAVVKLAGAAKLAVIARVFGASDALDAFLVAFLLPSFVAEVAGASFNAAFVPAYVRIREQRGLAAAREFFARAAGLLALILSAAAVLLFIFRRPLLLLVASGFTAGKLALSESMFAAMVPLAVLIGMSSLWRAVLNAGGRFALPAIAPLMTPAITIGLLAAAGARWGAHLLTAGAIGGTILELVLIAEALTRNGVSPWPSLFRLGPDLRDVIREYLPVVGGAALASGAVLVDTGMAATLGSGSVSALSYGTKLAAVILAIGPTAVSTAALPHFSMLAAGASRETVRRTLLIYAGLVAAVAVPFTAVLIWFSWPVARLFFQGGAFTEANTRLVAVVQSYSLAQVPIAMLVAALSRLISSLRANRLLLWGAGLTFALTPAFDCLLMSRLGVAGISLARTLVLLVSLFYMGLVLPKLLSRGHGAAMPATARAGAEESHGEGAS